MSHQASSWAAKQSGAGRGPKLLLLVLANHADPFGVCFPGQDGLAEECECGVRTVRRDMESLEVHRLIARARRVTAAGGRTSDWIVLAPGGERGDMRLPTEPDYPPDVVALASRSLPANLAGCPTGQSGLRSPVSGEQTEGARGSSDSSLRPLKGAEKNPPPPSPAARAHEGEADRDSRALDRLAAELRPFVGPVRQVLARVAAERPGAYEPTVAAVCSALDAYPRKDFLPLVRDYEHWALHGRGRSGRVRDVVRQWRNWIEKEPDVLRRSRLGEAQTVRRGARLGQQHTHEDILRDAAERPPTQPGLVKAWRRVVDQLLGADEVPGPHLQPVEPVGLAAGRLFLWAPVGVRWTVSQRYLPVIAAYARRVWPDVTDVEVVDSGWRQEAA